MKTKKVKQFVLAGTIALSCFISPLAATVYYVNSDTGNDAASGTSEAQAWRSLSKAGNFAFKSGDIVQFVRGGLWRGSITSKSGVTYTCYGSDNLPKPCIYGSTSLKNTTDWVQDGTLWRTSQTINADVGNLIFNGNRAGVKCWSKEQVTKNDRFWYDPATKYLWLASVGNPAGTGNELEAALTIDVIKCAGNQITISNLDIRYGGAHAINVGGGSSNIIIRDCDISWTGGGLLGPVPSGTYGWTLSNWYKGEGNSDIIMSISGGVPVRYGNGVQFWHYSPDCIVEGCRFWEIYDTALTNQSPDGEHRNITYRNNIIWNCEQSYEFWNYGPVTDNIVFTNNICLNAGSGWGHAQRPDQNGCHLLFLWSSPSGTTNFKVTNNVFAGATEAIFSMDDVNWVNGLYMNHNAWSQPSGSVYVRWKGQNIKRFLDYQLSTVLDKNSVQYNCTQ